MTDRIGNAGDPHTLSAFDADLRELRTMISEMGSRAEFALDRVMTALSEGDHDLAAQVVVNDAAIDSLETRIGEHVIRLIARRAPMADDLREVLSAHRIAGVIERVGDYAKTIAKRVPLLTEPPAKEPMAMLADLASGARAMLRFALDALAGRDAEMAAAVTARDRDIDDLYNRLFLAILAQMAKTHADIATSTQLLFIAKSLERVGDQATNIAELVFYAAAGKRLPDRHGSLGV